MNEIKTTKIIGQCGTSLTINVTKESRALNLDRGDYVEITIKPAMIKTCNNCGNCGGWYDEGYGYGEYICNLNPAPEEINGECPGWTPRKNDQ